MGWTENLASQTEYDFDVRRSYSATVKVGLRHQIVSTSEFILMIDKKNL